ncbi:MAG: ABC transporter ATP-binding protein [Gammaproteobacteria bacterium]|nr:ABC transporter ATP-binding protein [Gammaproteobacteria bacterium]
MSEPALVVERLSKTYANGFTALEDVSLTIETGEIFALLGPNGAGKTTLISTVCGLSQASEGNAKIFGIDTVAQYKQARTLVGLVPQELTTDAFETVWNTVSFSRALFGLPPNPAHIENILKRLTLWEKRNSPLMALSGGMKRRVMIAKALSHEPKILFLDEPSAGVDVSLRRDMWTMVSDLKQQGVTIILTTHYIEEAEELADRVGIINGGKILLVNTKRELMEQLGQKHLVVTLANPIATLPESLSAIGATLNNAGDQVQLSYETKDTGRLGELMEMLAQTQLKVADIQTEQSSLEDIFLSIVGESA